MREIRLLIVPSLCFGLILLGLPQVSVASEVPSKNVPRQSAQVRNTELQTRQVERGRELITCLLVKKGICAEDAKAKVAMLTDSDIQRVMASAAALEHGKSQASDTLCVMLIIILGLGLFIGFMALATHRTTY